MKDKIRKFIDSKTFYVILSIVLAICAWLLVLSYTNPIKTRTMEIQIQFLHKDAPANLDLQDQTVTYPKTVTVTVSGRQDVINNLSASELNTTVDLGEISKAGTTKLKVSKPACDRLGVSVDDYYPKTIEFTYDTVVRKNLDIRFKYDQSLLKEGYEFVSVTSTVSSIPVSGLASLLETCAYVEVDLTDSITAGSLDADKTAAFLGRYISVTGEDITHRFTEQQITVNIKIAKKVALTYRKSGNPHADYYLNKISVSPEYVLVVGDQETLRNLNQLDIGEIQLSNATQTFTKEVPVKDVLKQEGCSLVQNTTAKITAEILKYATKEFTITLAEIDKPGLNTERFKYEIAPESMQISIRGKQDAIQNLKLSALKPTLNLTAQTATGVGTYNVLLEFAGLEDNPDLTTFEEYRFTVVISNLSSEENQAAPSGSPAPTLLEPPATAP